MSQPRPRVLTVRKRHDGRWDWSIGREGSTFGYSTPEQALDNALWREVEHDDVHIVHVTHEQERIHGETLLWQDQQRAAQEARA